MGSAWLRRLTHVDVFGVVSTMRWLTARLLRYVSYLDLVFISYWVKLTEVRDQNVVYTRTFSLTIR